MIEISHLTKRYGALTAVDDISFNVSSGEVLGFLGPNGAGKSTTMKMITGFLAPTSGKVRVAGYDVVEAPIAAKRCMGYLPEGAPSYPEMTVETFLNFIADVRGLTTQQRKARLDEVIERLALAPVLPQVIETLSKGFKRRVGLAQAILHDPRVLILDEPTDGLDPNQKHEVRTLINAMASDKIIVISTHILEEVAAVCNRAIIIAGGKLLADDTPQALEQRSRYHNAVTLRFNSPHVLAAARERIGAVGEVAEVELREKEQRITAVPHPGHAVLPTLSALAQRERWDLKEIHLEAGRLDEVFRAITTAPRPEVSHG
ncbi:MAG: ABC transporter ATP-binding protein [Steroidobacteraceae bacterium]